MKAQHLICTVGTSLFHPNRDKILAGELGQETSLVELTTAYRTGGPETIASALVALGFEQRQAGAELNSINGITQKGLAEWDCSVHLLHSETPEGCEIAMILLEALEQFGHPNCSKVEIVGLQDTRPEEFRRKGLRNLAKEVCRLPRQYTPGACAVNATGGYKAQIAVAVMLGQALGMPVYYKHERFDEVIAFPPMPVALDLETWMQWSGMFFDLAGTFDPVPVESYGVLDEKADSLVERTAIGGADYIELTPTGQIFHETFVQRFGVERERMLPSAALAKRPPRLEQSGWPGAHPEVAAFMKQVTDEMPFVTQCGTFYFNPDLPSRAQFRLAPDGIEGWCGKGYTVKFRVETTAQTKGQTMACVAALNEWLANQ